MSSTAQGLQLLAIILFPTVESTESISSGGQKRVQCKTPWEIGPCDY